MENKELIAKSLGFVQDKYYSANERMDQKNLVNGIMKF